MDLGERKGRIMSFFIENGEKSIHHSENLRTLNIKYLDYYGQPKELNAEGMLATCIQHEMDHLDGILFLDRVASLKRDVFRRKGFEPRFDAREYPRIVGEENS